MIRWQTLGEVPAFSRSAALVGGVVYAIGPHKRDTVAFDLSTGQAEPIPPMANHKRSATLVAAGDTLLAVTGNRNQGVVQAYDAQTRSWSQVGTLRTQVFSTSAVAFGDGVFLIGGREHSERGAKSVSDIERYDVAGGTSELVAVLPRALSDVHVALRANEPVIDVLGGDFVEGGRGMSFGGSEAETVSDWHGFYPETGDVRIAGTGKTPRPVSEGGAVWDAHGRLYLVAGADRAVYLFDVARNSWEADRPLDEPGAYADAFLHDGRVIVIHGGKVRATDIEAASPVAPPPAPTAATSAGGGWIVRARGEAGPFATREEAEAAALGFLRQGLAAEIDEC